MFIAGVLVTSASIALGDVHAGSASPSLRVSLPTGLAAAASDQAVAAEPGPTPAVIITPDPHSGTRPLATTSAPAPSVTPVPSVLPAPRSTPSPTPTAPPVPASSPGTDSSSPAPASPDSSQVDPSPAPAATPSDPPVPSPVPTPAAPSQLHLDQLARSVNQAVGQSGGHVTVSLVELGGPQPQTWSLNGSLQLPAASTYKLPALMDSAALIAATRASGGDQLCYQPNEWEDGWFSDYQPGSCYSRSETAYRAAHFSDNTAGHMLVADIGGGASLNSFARSNGAVGSSFFDGNTTTSDDLAQLWTAEARGRMGGAAAQSWLYPLLTGTAFESGIPAGVPAGTTVVHKTGELDPVVNDAALVSGGANGAYVLVVMTDSPGGDAGWALISRISAAVWQYEQSRQA